MAIRTTTREALEPADPPGRRYLALPVPAALSAWVDAVWWQRSAPDPAADPTVVLPTDGATLLVNRGDPFEHVLPAAETLASVTLHGVRTRRVTARATGRTDLLIINLRPWAVERIAGVGAAALTDRFASLDEIHPTGALERFVDALRAAEDGPGCLVAIAALGERLDRAGPDPQLGAVLLRVGAGAALGPLAEEFGMSPRHFRRWFQRQIGLSPKRYQGLRRCQAALRELRRGSPAADVALTCGFADQSHLVREVRRHTGFTPSRFQRPERPGSLQRCYNDLAGGGRSEVIYA